MNKDKRKKQEQRIKKEELNLGKIKKSYRNLKSGKKKIKSKTNGKSSRKTGGFFLKEEKKETVQDTIPYKRMLKDGIFRLKRII